MRRGSHPPYGAVLTCLLIYYPPVVHALHSFHTNCTRPANDEHYGYVASPNVRGSVQLVWTCVLTLYVCTYQVIHPDVHPPVDEAEELQNKKKKWSVRRWAESALDSSALASFLLALVSVLAPEYIFVDACWHFWVARTHLHELHEAVPASKEAGGGGWTLAHMMYANTDGIVARRGVRDAKLSSMHIRDAIDVGVLSVEPPVSAGELKDKSKDNSFAILVAVGQIGYFYVQFLARMTEGYTISQLELTVASFAAYSILAFGFLWHMPKSIMIPTVVVVHDEIAASEGNEAGGSGGGGSSAKIEFLRRAEEESKESKWNAWDIQPEKGRNTASPWTIIFWVASIPVGAIHVAGWSLSYPSTVDMWIWRAASITTTAIPLILLVQAWFGKQWFWSDVSNMLLLVVARLILFVEIVRCLFYLPGDAFAIASWTLGLPHIG